jgi:type IV secretion system protein VirB10
MSASKDEPLKLRGTPRPARQFKRRVVIGLAASGCAVIAGATLIALHPPTFHRESGSELFNVERKPTAEGLSTLPRNYGDLKPPAPPPQLGPPLPGDLGPPVVHMERDMGLRQPPPAAPSMFHPNPEADAERAERLRLARQAQSARESTVMFRINARRAGEAPTQREIPAAAQVAPETRQLELDPERDPGHQQRKLDFVDRAGSREVINPNPLRDPVSAYQVMAGSVIAAALITGLNSDLPGLVVAQVTEPVYDTVTGSTLLIPQGTRLIGRYDSVVAFGQKRALVVWHRLVMPDGSSIVLDNMPATDNAGYAGLEDEVDFHSWQLVKGVALSTLLGMGAELGTDRSDGDLLRLLRQGAQGAINRAGQRLVERQLNVQPTLTIRPGWPVRVIVHKDLVLRPYRT